MSADYLYCVRDAQHPAHFSKRRRRQSESPAGTQVSAGSCGGRSRGPGSPISPGSLLVAFAMAADDWAGAGVAAMADCLTSISFSSRPLASRLVPYLADPARYESMIYRRCGRSGVRLPAISLGLWHNFGDDRPWETQREICRRAFDLGVTHFDLANNYGPPYGAAESNFGRILATDFAAHRDELLISTKAGYDMWPGPYGDLGSRKYLLASLDQSLTRMGLDYVDIFYSHRVDPDTPMEETAGALASAVTQGKALYVGISSYSSERTLRMAELLAEHKVPLLIHQPSYSMFNRWTEGDHLLDTLEDVGAGCIAFSPLAQGLLTDRYLHGIPSDSRAATGGALKANSITEQRLARVRALNEIAGRRGQTLAELALVWALRDPRMTSLVIGASHVTQLVDNIAALRNMSFTADELAEIDQHATDADINLWKRSSDQ
jgi:L-glyceraldehyde 3-phosphate reductase